MMMIFTAKVSKRKVALAVLAAAALVVVLVLLVRGSGKAETPEGVRVTDISSNEDRLAFLSAYGWEAETEPINTQTVHIPEEQNEVLRQYLALQESQGFHLADYAGKDATQYVYQVTNYPDARGEVHATLLIYKNRIIGGDVCCQWEGGGISGFASKTQDAAPDPAAPTQEGTDANLPSDSIA